MGNPLQLAVAWLVPKPPDHITADFRAFYESIRIGSLFVILAHVVLAVYWWGVGVPEMVTYHYIGLPILVISAFLARIGRTVVAGAIISIEFIAHAALGTYFVGCFSAMHATLTMGAVVWAAFPGKRATRYRMIGVLLIFVQMAIVGLSMGRPPVYHLSTTVLRWTAMAMVAFTVIPLFMLNVLQNVAADWYESLQVAREKSEHLLLNVLPQTIADRLKENEHLIADRFDSASVLFLDIVDFTRLSSNMAASEVVSLLNSIFTVFDSLTDKYGLEKIKTIGDAYMVVAGVPDPKPDHARRIAHLAIDMIDALDKSYSSLETKVKARIGICSGPVVAGVIGTRKFIYDLWGDTVNTASRMESHGVPNQIQVTESTYQILKDDYDFESRGEIEVKGKGRMRTWILIGVRQR